MPRKRPQAAGENRCAQGDRPRDAVRSIRAHLHPMRPEVNAIMSRQHGLVTRRQAVDAGLPPDRIDRLVRLNAWTKVRRGVYAETAYVATITTYREKRLLVDRAASLRVTMPHVVSHDSAAHELDLPILRPARPMTHVTRPVVVGTHNVHGIKHHLAPYGSGQVVEIGSVRVLDVARTAVDIAREHGNPAGVCAIDSARRAGASLGELETAVAAMRNWPEVTVAREAIELSDPDSDSLGESMSRLLVEELGFGRPQTQFGLTADGRTAWCDLRLGRHMFEFDGHIKYLRVEKGGVATVDADEVVWREKQRQDWVCGFKLGMSRIVWADFWGAARAAALVRLRREYLDTCERFGESITDLSPYLARGPRPRPGRRPNAA